MIDGITILNQYEQVVTDWQWTPLCTAIVVIAAVVVIGVIPVVSALLDASDFVFDLFEIIAVIATAVILYNSIGEVETERYNIYEVTIDESVSLNEFYNKYEIIDQHGKIYEIKERNTEND